MHYYEIPTLLPTNGITSHIRKCTFTRTCAIYTYSRIIFLIPQYTLFCIFPRLSNKFQKNISIYAGKAYIRIGIPYMRLKRLY